MTSPVTASLAFLLLLQYSWKLTLVLLVLIPLQLFLANYTTKKLKKITGVFQKNLGESNEIIRDIVNGSNEVKSFNLQNQSLDWYENSLQKIDKIFKLSADKLLNSNMLGYANQSITILVIVSVSVFLIARGELTLGGMIAATELQRYLRNILRFFPESLARYRQALGKLERIFKVMDLPAEKWGENDYPLENNHTIIELNRFQ